nr:MAG TPA: hypothetical protein [Caudoviricetes sp.]
MLFTNKSLHLLSKGYIVLLTFQHTPFYNNKVYLIKKLQKKSSTKICKTLILDKIL